MGTTAFHGGEFWSYVGADFETLSRITEIVPADVLDAWFPPAPEVVACLQDHAALFARSSPPADCAGLVRAISDVRGICRESIVLGPGSSSLIFLALRQWLSPSSRVLILDPTYGEYAHVLNHVIGCSFEVLPVSRRNSYALPLSELRERGGDYDFVVLVNPNSPTGAFTDGPALIDSIKSLPDSTTVWVDEAYIDYVGAAHSLETYASSLDNLVVCKSLSKGYALSGMRAAYLACHANRAEELRRITPPWAVSLPAQAASKFALENPAYYSRRYAETADLRSQLAARLQWLPGVDVFEGSTNSLLLHLDQPARILVEGCRGRGVYLRDTASMFQAREVNAVRVAVRSSAENERISDAIIEVLSHNFEAAYA